MTYYEEAIVKKYKRKNNKDSTQINLGVNSKFKKDTKVVITSRKNFEGLNKNIEAFKKGFMTELEENSKMIVDENEYNNLVKEKNELQQDKDKLSDEYNNLVKEKNELQQDKDKFADKVNSLQQEIIQLQQEHKSELKTQTDKVEKLLILINSKDNQINTLTSKWKWYKRIFNILPSGIDTSENDDK